MLVVAATDPAAVDAQLRPQLGNQLCIVHSRWTKQQLEDAFAQIRANWDPWRLFQAGPSHDEEGQPHIDAAPAWVTNDIAGWSDTQPDGLVTIAPWLSPIH